MLFRPMYLALAFGLGFISGALTIVVVGFILVKRDEEENLPPWQHARYSKPQR